MYIYYSMQLWIIFPKILSRGYDKVNSLVLND